MVKDTVDIVYTVAYSPFFGYALWTAIGILVIFLGVVFADHELGRRHYQRGPSRLE
jgi:hypothetical protein